MAGQAFLLGYKDEKVSKNSPVDCYTDKIGGEPDWPAGCSIPTPTCRLCSGPLTLVVQLYCPVGSTEERTLYLFVCLGQRCKDRTEGWTAYRCQGKVRPPTPERLAANMEKNLHLNDPPRNTKAKSKPPFFDSFYIATEREYLEKLKPVEKKRMDKLLGAYESVKETKDKRGANESYEKVPAKHGDKIAHKFVSKISLNPGQIMRYKVGGNPFHVSKVEQARYSVPKCQYCGAQRQFEFQVTPSLQPCLSLGPKSKDISVDFGTVIVSTCISNCWNSSSLRQEHAVLQLDPETELLKKFE